MWKGVLAVNRYRLDKRYRMRYVPLMRKKVLKKAPPYVPGAIDEKDWHLKPEGWNGAPCPVCGCPAKRLKAEHRALKVSEIKTYSGKLCLWKKSVKVSFGTDSTEVWIDAEGGSHG